MNKEKKSNSRFKTLLKFMLGTFLGVVLLLLIGSWIIVAFYSNEVKQQIVKKLNVYLAVPVAVADIDFTIWKTFPLASVDLKNVIIYDALSKSKNEKFLEAEHFYLSINLLDILNKTYKIRASEVVNAKINLRFNKQGKGNYKFWKDLKETTDTTTTNFYLKKIIGNNIEFKYYHPLYKQQYKIHFNTLVLSGNFSDKKYDLQVNTSGFIYHLINGGINYVSNKNVTLTLNLAVKNNEVYSINKGDLHLAEVPFKITGKIINDTLNTNLDLKIIENHATVHQLLGLIPANFKKKLKDYKSEGLVKFNITIKGNTGNGNTPTVRADFSLNNGKIIFNDISLSDINLIGFYSNGKSCNNSTSLINLSKLTAVINRQAVSGNLLIHNFDKPTASGNLNGTVNLADIQSFIKTDTLQNIKGNVQFELTFNWPLHGEQNKERLFAEYKTNGYINFKDVGFSLKHRNAALQNFNGNFSFNNQHVKINFLQGFIGSSDIQLKGYFENLVPYFMGLTSKLRISADFISNVLKIDEVLAYKSDKTNEKYFRLIFPEDLNFDIRATISQLKFDKFSATDATGNITMKNRRIILDNLNFNAFNGNIKLNGVLNGQDTSKLLTILETESQALDLKKIFYQLNNFGQSYLTDKNLKGLLTAQTHLQMNLTNNLTIIPESIIMQSNITIDNGELTNYEALMSLSDFIEVSELKNVRFSSLKNTIEIKNKTVFIPKMEVKSSAINLTITGTHTFDQYLDYYIKVGLFDLLAAKHRKKKTINEFGEYEVKEKQINLFIRAYGPIDNLKFKYDKAGFKKHLTDELINEKNTIKSLLKQEFGLFKNDTTIVFPSKKEQTPPIELEWEDSKPDKDNNEVQQKKKLQPESVSPKNNISPKKTNKIINKLLQENNKQENADDIN